MNPSQGRPTRRTAQRGQVVLLFAMFLTFLLGASALAVDGGWGQYQQRQAQNAADLAALAAAGVLSPACGSASTIPGTQVYDAIVDIIATNAPNAVGSPWVATYLDSDGRGAPTPASPSPVSPAAAPPANACGASVTVSPVWPTFLARMIGLAQLRTTANASAAGSTRKSAIMALAPFQGHTVFINGNGRMIVNGDITVNSAGCNDDSSNPEDLCGNPPPGGVNRDSIENFRDSKMFVYGHIIARDRPFDDCYYSGPVPNVTRSPEPQFPGVAGVDAAPPANTTDCRPPHARHWRTDAGYLYYNHVDSIGAPAADPFASLVPPAGAGCGGTYDAAAPGWTGSPPTYSPGVYNYPVVVTGGAKFADCTGSPGVYVFNEGVEICPQLAGQAVTGSNVMLYAAKRFSAAAGCPGAGVGEDGDDGFDNSDDLHYGPSSAASSGNRDIWSDDGVAPATLHVGMFLGGVKDTSVTLSAPTSGVYAGMLLYQNRAIPANTGLNASKTSGATIDLTGTVYNASMDTSDRRNALSLICDFSPAGYGGRMITGWRLCGSTTQATDANVSIHGGAVVDVFDSPGDGTLLVDAGSGSGKIRLVR